MFLAKSAIFLKFDTFCIILFILHCIVISILAFSTSKSNFCSLSNCHLKHLPKIKQTAPMLSLNNLPYFFLYVKRYLIIFAKIFYFPDLSLEINFLRRFLVCSATLKIQFHIGLNCKSNSPIISVA